MLIKRFEDAQPYEAPNHWGVSGLRLQGFEEGGPTNQWIGYSQFLPGGGAGPDATPVEFMPVHGGLVNFGPTDAELMEFEGMGHVPDESQWEQILDRMVERLG